uniref:Uncharacterized protein n=1 Tax=Urocitellus parryii TaxID=9999 RepID=A0A8D2HLK1_UROPR
MISLPKVTTLKSLSSGFLESSLETLTWSLLSCLLLPHQTVSWIFLSHSISYIT